MYSLYMPLSHTQIRTVLKYLAFIGNQDVTPIMLYWNQFPDWATNSTPAIETINGKRYVGLKACLEYYEERYHVVNLMDKAVRFSERSPDFDPTVVCWDWEQIPL